MNNNFFFYSPKELTTDAFLAWLFLEFNDNPKLKNKTVDFFIGLGLCAVNTKMVNEISVDKQKQKTDLIIRYKADGKLMGALFENKTTSSIHSD